MQATAVAQATKATEAAMANKAKEPIVSDCCAQRAAAC